MNLRSFSPRPSPRREKKDSLDYNLSFYGRRDFYLQKTYCCSYQVPCNQFGIGRKINKCHTTQLPVATTIGHVFVLSVEAKELINVKRLLKRTAQLYSVHHISPYSQMLKKFSVAVPFSIKLPLYFTSRQPHFHTCKLYTTVTN